MTTRKKKKSKQLNVQYMYNFFYFAPQCLNPELVKINCCENYNYSKIHFLHDIQVTQ